MHGASMRSTITVILIICGRALAQLPSSNQIPDRVGALQGQSANDVQSFMNAVGAPSVTGQFTVAATPQGLHFVPLSPCRIADTRNAVGPFGGPQIGGGLTRT